MAAMRDELRDAVSAAAVRAEVCCSVADVYATLADAIDIRRPICKTSGRCCRFEEFGHRLYVSTMELAKFVADRRLSENARPLKTEIAGDRALPLFDQAKMQAGASAAGSDKPGCPFQVDGLCGVHGIRPFGCRIFFCDETSTVWQNEVYEHLHGRLRKLHEELEVPYFYVEWRFALSAVMPLTSTRK